MTEDWLGRWQQNRTGWHEPRGNAGLRQHWPDLPRGSRVLVPMCGKSVDMLWLARRGLFVSGVEIAARAIEAFFAEQELPYDFERGGSIDAYRAKDHPITLYCGDFFAFHGAPFDALYDRGALVALPEDVRPRYVNRLQELLKANAYRLIVTLEYDQRRVSGPPYSVLPEEILNYWPDLERLSAANAIDNGPPKFREAGLAEMIEAVWSSEKAAARRAGRR